MLLVLFFAAVWGASEVQFTMCRMGCDDQHQHCSPEHKGFPKVHPVFDASGKAICYAWQGYQEDNKVKGSPFSSLQGVSDGKNGYYLAGLNNSQCGMTAEVMHAPLAGCEVGKCCRMVVFRDDTLFNAIVFYKSDASSATTAPTGALPPPLSGGAIAGIVLGTLGMATLLVVGGVVFYRRSKRTQYSAI
jgi:hypothetical protein